MKLLKYLVIIAVVFTSCKAKKDLVGTDSGVKKLSVKKVVKNHLAANFNKKTVDANLKVNYKNPKQSIGFSLRMKIKKDEVIWLKGTKFITVFKAKITPTKVSYYSPYKKDYFEGDFSMLKKILGVDVNFNQLQNMLLGQAMADLENEKQTVEAVENVYVVSPKNQNNLFEAFFHINPINYKLKNQSILGTIKNQELTISYPGYFDKDNTFFPSKMFIKASDDTKTTTFDINVRSVVYDTDLSMPFRIPSGYKKLQF